MQYFSSHFSPSHLQNESLSRAPSSYSQAQAAPSVLMVINITSLKISSATRGHVSSRPPVSDQILLFKQFYIQILPHNL